MAGRKKVTKLKAFEGDKYLPENEPEPIVKDIATPEWLDEEAQKAFEKGAEILKPLGLLTEADGDAFAFLCQIRSRLITIIEYVNEKESDLPKCGDSC